MYQFEAPYYFYFLGILPILLLFFALYLVWKKRAQNRFANKKAIKKLSTNRSGFKLALKISFILLALFALVIALVNPKIGTKIEEVKREGVDLVFAMDVSKSMLAEDIAPNRLEKSKQLVSQILSNLGGDRVGIIGYAGSAFPQLPITTDFNSARMFLNAMNTDMVSSRGTAIAEAINLAKTYYNDEDQTNKVLIILTDGEDHEGNVSAEALEAAELGIKIITIGVGTVSGGPIPIKQNGILQEYMRDQNNERVVTALNETTLIEIANQTGGEYIKGDVTSQVVDKVKELLNNMDKKEFEAKQFADFQDQFQWFIGAAIFFLFFDIFFLERKTVWLQKLNLFNENKKQEGN
ncbi:MAG: BatB protein [Flavobacteriaceae bacterium CG_4_8_14_3_um_filter_34_10]|nr:VWA domain-containing protein [Flavobacteriia bacterium]PIQ18101.1 MAG: BatB protein [Flavobacteriaceae bacterium CG18_big_fil_WC_8_21_14_2_50_34_36]PIV51280.1 MAG: BatB protein [Flavobacteriaceae bacterium CG02_land_8_20_14_3_00_34_13]PIX10272.1 MAG: BatB protein [Flavobacteriaceae bacterium CG_4_8_14_3_um_filter_34_10]PIZ08589.1 MAG: BatB protein [Flavobacteriaceae bacterium CG_4_10_14_0_8_um_filter_34_31]PJC07096.1 MAG: BatB protein [Flavobacteriaceae bacterium CG_4_9_14_0_8_um_filter_34